MGCTVMYNLKMNMYKHTYTLIDTVYIYSLTLPMSTDTIGGAVGRKPPSDKQRRKELRHCGRTRRNLYMDGHKTCVYQWQL